MIRAWLFGVADRILPIYPDPEGYGQPRLDPHAFMTDATFRSLPAPPEIQDAGGFCIGLEIAFPVGDYQLQPMGPVIALMVTPIGQDRSEVRIFFPPGISYEGRDALTRVAEEFRRAWPDVAIYNDSMPWWSDQGFNRRALFAAIATGGPAPPGAPPRRPRNYPLPWRDQPARERRPLGLVRE